MALVVQGKGKAITYVTIYNTLASCATRTSDHAKGWPIHNWWLTV